MNKNDFLNDGKNLLTGNDFIKVKLFADQCFNLPNLNDLETTINIFNNFANKLGKLGHPLNYQLISINLLINSNYLNEFNTPAAHLNDYLFNRIIDLSIKFEQTKFQMKKIQKMCIKFDYCFNKVAIQEINNIQSNFDQKYLNAIENWQNLVIIFGKNLEFSFKYSRLIKISTSTKKNKVRRLQK